MATNEPVLTKINIEGTARKQMTVTLVGKVYNVYVPKTAVALKFAGKMEEFEKDPAKAANDLDMLYRAIFTPADYTKIQKRLEDPKDNLDLEELVELMGALLEEAAEGDPTTSSSAS